MQLCAKRGELVEFTWQSGNLAPWLVVSRVAVWRQQAADNLQETDKLDIYTERLQSKGLVTQYAAMHLRERFSEECALGALSDRNTFFLIAVTLAVGFFSFSEEALETFLFSLSTDKFSF